MTKLTLSLMDSNDNVIKKESLIMNDFEQKEPVGPFDSKELIESVVLLCSKMSIGVPILTVVEEKSLFRYNEVVIHDEEYGDKTLKISLEPA